MSRDSREIGFGKLLEEQGLLNHYLVLNLIRIQIELQSEVPEINRLREIVRDLMLNRGKHSSEDLLTAINEVDFNEDTKTMFKTCLAFIGIRE